MLASFMRRTHQRPLVPALTVCGLLLGLTAHRAPAAESCQSRAKAILEATGVRGGLVVHIGCGDGKLTAALRADDSYLVHGLTADDADLTKAREPIRALGLYGEVTVDLLRGKQLPYADNLVNLVVAEDLCGVPMAEVMRVLAPQGVAYVQSGGSWTKTVKPRPEAIDEWTHCLYDATNNAVCDDTVVGPPRQLQWVRGPKWARSHDHLASVTAVVSAGGRVFYIVDRGPTAAVVLDAKWFLVACDAFSGVTLWERPIDRWQWHLRGFRSGPPDLSRRLVAVGDRVYVTLGLGEPLSELDAATGKTLRTFPNTKDALEAIIDDGILYAVAGQPEAQQAADRAHRRGKRPGFEQVRPQRPAYTETPPIKRIIAIDIAGGKTLWTKSDAETRELMPTALAAADGKVYFQNPDDIVCLNARNGQKVWTAARPVSRKRLSWTAPTLVAYGDVVLSGDRKIEQRSADVPDDGRKVEWLVSSAGGRAPVGEVIAFSAKTGERLWSAPCKECYNAPVDVLVADDLVWTGELVQAREPGITRGLDPRTGQPRRTRPSDLEFFRPGMGHHRCYRNRGTPKYLVLGRSGVEFIDLKTGDGIAHHWTRGTCQYGVIPCNGLLYVPPHSCACFIRSKLNGFNCFAPGDTSLELRIDKRGRLEKGPAFDHPIADETTAKTDWPCYRGDPARSGRAASSVPARLQPGWTTHLGGDLSSVVVAGGRVFVAQVDTHTVHALNAADGGSLWAHVAGGRVDSPPTVWKGRVYFGSADGRVTCLRAADGSLVWRFRAAPQDRRIVAYGRLESLWPVHGSVLVRDGVVYCAAGRSSYLDGGMRLVRLDARSGNLLSETVIDHRDPKTGYQPKEVVRGTSMPGALPDVLSCKGDSVFLRHLRFDLAGKQLDKSVPHLYSPAGFLDDAWWHRTYWQYGTAMATAYGGWPRVGMRVPAGRLLAVDGSRVYGFGRSQYHHTGGHLGIDSATVFHFRPPRDEKHRETHYEAFSVVMPDPKDVAQAHARPKRGKKGGKKPPVPRKRYLWRCKLPVLARAIVLAEDHLVLAGPPDLFATDDPIAALQGKKGGKLVVLNKKQGKPVAQTRLDSPPVFDGMAAAGGAIYLATMDGKIVCLRGKG